MAYYSNFSYLQKLKYILKWTVLLVLMSVAIGSASAFFLTSLTWVGEYRNAHSYIVYFLPLAGLLIGLIYHYLGKSSSDGNNLIIEELQQNGKGKILPWIMAPLILATTLLTHLFGGSAGREGTAIQMSGSISDRLTLPFRLSEKERYILLIASVAAGFGSIFGTPLAGAIFALEFYFIGKIKYTAIFQAFFAAVLADYVTKWWQVPHTHYHINSITEVSLLNITYMCVAAIAFGTCALLFSKSLHYLTDIYKKYISYAPLRPFIGGFVIILLFLMVDTNKYLGLGIPTIQSAFEQPLPYYDFAFKVIFTVATLSAGFKGGEVTPLFFIGATLGNALGYFIPLPFELLAGAGFVAVFAGATNTPLACIIMGIELFGVEHGVYIAIACTVGYLVSGKSSIYKSQMVGLVESRE